MRRSLTIAALAAGGLLSLGIGAPAAVAADSCPNAAVRAQQGVQHLPHCMAYEKLTPINKNGAPIGAEFLMSDDGSQAFVYAGSSIVEGTTSGMSSELLATRGADGWSLESLLDSPAWGARRNLTSSDYPQVYGVDGMRRVLYSTLAPLDPGDVGGGVAMNGADFYLREDDGTLRWLTRPEGFAYAPHDPAGVSVGLFKAAPDLSTMLFGTSRVMNRSIDATERDHIWLWRDGKPYEMVDYMPDGSVSTQTDFTLVNGTGSTRLLGRSLAVSPDFSTVAWQTLVRVGRTTTETLYVRAGIGTPQARTLEVGRTGATVCTTEASFKGLTIDGRYVRFFCNLKLTDDAPANGGDYVQDTQTGTVIYDTPQVDRGPMTTDPVNGWTRPDGTYRLEDRRVQGLWSVHLPTGEEKCVTCFDGKVAQAAASGGHGVPSVGGMGTSDRNLITPEGDVFFVSSEQLVPEDTNAFRDLYISIDGKPHLLSGGDAGRDVQFGGVSLDGSTASFVTTSTLLAEDQDGGGPDVYVVRRNGGFLRAAQPAECTAGCQGPAILHEARLAPLSTGFFGPGNIEDDASDAAVARISTSGSRSVRGTSVKVKVRTPGAGRVTVSGNGVRKSSRSVKSATSATVTVKLSARSKRLLRKRSSLKRRATVRFVPTEGKSQTKRVNLTFRKAKKKASKSKKKGSSRSVAAASNGKAAR